MSEILKTSDYSIFKKHANNREIDSSNLKKLCASISMNNLLMFRPILVDSDMQVIDGQHRLEAAKKLGYEIYYQMVESTRGSCSDIILLNANQKGWSLEDYVNYYKNYGNENYIKISAFCRENQVSVCEFMKSCSRSNWAHVGRAIRLGSFQFPSPEQEKEHADFFIKRRRIQAFIHELKINDPHYSGLQKLCDGLGRLMRHPNFNEEVLISNVSKKASLLRRCATGTDYYLMLLDIYNWNNRDPLE